MLTLIAEPAPRAGKVGLAPGYEIRPCRRFDTEALGRLYYDAYDPGVACATLEEAITDVRASFAGEYGELWSTASQVVLYGGELVAAVLTVRRAPWEGTPDCPFIIELFTARPHRRKGLARILVDRCLAAAREAGEPGVALRVDENNVPARALYDAFEFRAWQANPGAA